nr:zinc finger, CCHC-type [Tanacetum cinerariifolium]
MAWKTDYCIMKEGMSILRGQKSVPGMNSRERENGKRDFMTRRVLLRCDNTGDLYPVSTIRLLIAMASIHNLIIHQIDMKTAFLNGELDEEVDLIKEFLSLRFSIKDMGEADVILGIRFKHESNGIAISQSHYIKKGKIVGISLYVTTLTELPFVS